MRICLCLIVSVFISTAAHGQTCKTGSIPATTPDSQLVDNNDGTITDTKTGLMWKKCQEGSSGNDCATGSETTFNWQQALEHPGVVNTSGFAGHTDWRLPNIKELKSIVEYQCDDPAINLNRFPNTSSSFVWSGSASADYTDSAWSVYFYYGYSNYDNRGNVSRVRLVRDGQ